MGVPPKVLVVIGSRSGRRTAVRAAPPGSTVLETGNCEQARQALRANPDVGVVVCDLTLSDGSWWCVYHELLDYRQPAELVVLLPQRGLNASELEAHSVTVVPGGPLDEEELARVLRRAVDRPRLTATAGADR